MVQDYNEAKLLAKKEPKKFMAIRYEDFIMNIVPESKKLFNFLDLEMQDVTKEFIDKATHPPQPDVELPHNVHIRDPEQVINKWKARLTMKEINQIQKECQAAMKMWGYLPFKNNANSPTYTPTFAFP